jgi:GNAT superfamily N-acetyltransferase
VPVSKRENRAAVAKPPTRFVVKALMPDLWPAFEDLFGKSGACNGCWCMYWRLGSAYRQRARALNRRAFRDIVMHGPPPGLLAFDGEVAVGWCQLTARGCLGWLERSVAPRAGHDQAVWSISCFYVRRNYRRHGVTSALISAALKVAKRQKAAALEAYPVDADAPNSTLNLFTGVVSTFARAGFKPLAHRSRHRITMRHDLKAIRDSPERG